jgi:hypothetical protein
VSDDLFPASPWIGFNTFNSDLSRHRMDLTLDFGNGAATGDFKIWPLANGESDDNMEAGSKEELVEAVHGLAGTRES